MPTEFGVERGALGGQGFDFALAGQDAMDFGIGGMKTDAGRREHMALGADQHGAGGQFSSDFNAMRRIGQYVDAREPVSKHARQTRVGAGDVVGQALQTVGCGFFDHRARDDTVEGNFSWRHLGEPAMCLPQIRETDTVKTFAQNGFEGVFPTFADAYALPQMNIAAQIVAIQPGFEFARAADLLLQRLQSGEARIELMDPLLSPFRGFFSRLQRLFELRQRRLALLERIALAGKLMVKLADLGFQPDQFTEVRYFQAVALFLQPGVARRELQQQLFGMAFAGILEAQLLFRLRQDILCLGEQRLRGVVIFIRHRQCCARLPQRLPEHGKLFGGFGQSAGIVSTRRLQRLLPIALFRFLTAQGIKLLLGAFTAVAQELDLLFDAGDLRVDLVQRALRRMHVVRCLVMPGAQRLNPFFRVAQPSCFCFQLDAQCLDVAADLRALCLRIALAQRP